MFTSHRYCENTTKKSKNGIGNKNILQIKIIIINIVYKQVLGYGD